MGFKGFFEHFLLKTNKRGGQKGSKMVPKWVQNIGVLSKKPTWEIFQV